MIKGIKIQEQANARVSAVPSLVSRTDQCSSANSVAQLHTGTSTDINTLEAVTSTHQQRHQHSRGSDIKISPLLSHLRQRVNGHLDHLLLAMDGVLAQAELAGLHPTTLRHHGASRLACEWVHACLFCTSYQ
jgi:hypothetical protein